MATSKEKKKAEEKARAAKDAAKHAKESSKKSSSKDSSFNYKALGISQDTWNSLGSEGQSAMKVIGGGVMKIIDKNQPLPEVLDKNEMDKLWQEAESDPVIQKTYAEELKVAKDYIGKNIDLISSDFQNLTKQQQQQYLDAKKTINETQAAAGTAYSGFRTQVEKKAEKQQEAVVQSSKSALQQQLNTLESAYEQRFGSKALSELGIKGIGASTGDLIGGKYTGPVYGEVGFKPVGGIGGTQAQDILASKLQKQQDLAGESLQEIQLKNIEREKKQAEALSKLKV